MSTTAQADPEAATKQAVLRAYRAFWDDIVATARTCGVRKLDHSR